MVILLPLVDGSLILIFLLLNQHCDCLYFFQEIVASCCFLSVRVKNHCYAECSCIANTVFAEINARALNF